ncbi:MAG: YhbY family RNA-binding protein [Burkholderiales bacterium]
MPKQLTTPERQALKGRAHRLRPVVLVGADGLTPPVVAEVDRALQAHALIKIRVAGDDRDARERLLGEVCAATDAAPVQHIGKILVIYREPPEKPAPKAPPARRPPPRRKPERRARTPRPSRTPVPRRGKFRPR